MAKQRKKSRKQRQKSGRKPAPAKRAELTRRKPAGVARSATRSAETQRGIELLREGKLDEADRWLQRALRDQPNDAVALHATGIVAKSRGNVAEALDCFRRALEVFPGYAEAHNNLGIALRELGRLDEAVRSFERALSAKPGFAQALNNLGIALAKQQQSERALEALREARRLAPQLAETHNNLAIVLKELGQLDEARTSLDEALRIRPNFAQAHHTLGNVSAAQRELADAANHFRDALHYAPNFVPALYDLGCVLIDMGQLADAKRCLEQAAELDPNSAEVLNSLGRVLAEQREWDAAAARFHQALRIRPNLAQALSNLGSVLVEKDQLADAVTYYRLAVGEDPNDTTARANLGIVLRMQGEFEEARSCFRQLADQQPKAVLPRMRVLGTCPAVYPSIVEMDRYLAECTAQLQAASQNGAHVDVSRLATAACEPPWNLQFFPGNLRPVKEAFAELWRRQLQRHMPSVAPSRAGSSGPPRVGFVVTQRHEAIFARSMGGIVRRLNRHELQPLVFCAASGAVQLRQKLQSDAITIVPLPSRFDQVVETLRTAQLDLVYHWEIGTDSTNYFLPFFRVAPVQCTSWGTQLTSGIATVDHYLSSRLIEPDGANDHYSENLLRLDSLLPYQQRVQLPEQPKTRESFGLADTQHVYLCAQALGKFHPDFDGLLGEILRRDPTGVLVIVRDRSGTSAAVLQDRFQRTIADVADRIAWMPYLSTEDYLGLVHVADVLLDPLHFNGANTTYDGLALGKPIVTLPSPFQRGRYTLGCYEKMKFTDCVARDASDYVELAVRLGTDADYRTAVGEKIADASDCLFEEMEAVREHERIFLELTAEA